MIRPALVLILAGACMPAHATLVRLDYDLHSVPSVSNWLLPDPPPDTVQLSFTFDTASVTSTGFSFWEPGDGSSCVGHVDYSSADIYDISATSSTMSFGSDPTSHNGRLSGANPGGCPGMLFSTLTFSTNDLGIFGAVDFAGLSQADFESSADPIA